MKNLIYFFTLCPFVLFAQEPVIEWAKTFGGSKTEFANAIAVTQDNKYLVVGHTGSSDGDRTSSSRGSSDVWLLKLDENGSILWQKCYGGSGGETMQCLIQTLDNGFIMVGSTGSADGDVTENKGSADAWIIKIDSVGTIQWQKTIGGSDIETAKSVFQTKNGDYILGLYSKSNDKDFPVNSGGYDMWVVKLNNQGNIIWKKNISGTKDDFISEIVNIDDKTFAIAGKTDSEDGDMLGAWGDFSIKMDSSRNVIWKKSFGYPNDSLRGLKEFNAITMSKNDIVSVGMKIVTFAIPDPVPYTWDLLITKSDTSGNRKWSKLFGGSRTEAATSVKSFPNGDLIIVGFAQSNDGDVHDNHGDIDFWVLRLDSLGNLKNANCYGGSKEDQAYYSVIDKKGNIIVIGFSWSSNGTFSQNKGLTDWAIIKLNYGTTNTKEFVDEAFITEYPNPVVDKLTIQISSKTSPNLYIYDITGKLVYHLDNLQPKTTIDMAMFPKGFYLLTYQIDNQYISKKIVKM